MGVFGLSFGSSTLQHKKHQQFSSLPIDIGGARLDYAYQRKPWNWHSITPSQTVEKQLHAFVWN